MKAEDPTNGPDALPSSWTVRRTTASPPYSVAYGETMIPPGRVCRTMSAGISRREAVIRTRSYGALAGQPWEPSPTMATGL